MVSCFRCQNNAAGSGLLMCVDGWRPIYIWRPIGYPALIQGVLFLIFASVEEIHYVEMLSLGYRKALCAHMPYCATGGARTWKKAAYSFQVRSTFMIRLAIVQVTVNFPWERYFPKLQLILLLLTCLTIIIMICSSRCKFACSQWEYVSLLLSWLTWRPIVGVLGYLDLGGCL